MTKTILMLCLIINMVSCVNYPPGQRSDFTFVKDDLYKKSGELYLKVYLTGSRSILYLSVIYSDNFGEDGVAKIGKVIHLKSFKKLKNNYYQDKNHIYKLKIMYDSATLAVVDDHKITDD